ncbi:aromatic ring-hydroxylating oxygenase subunit alpha [Azospirillum himalayense]|uniref:Aromatic ring-hydroxylating dioxygenase subunit alpha n=1 Tax=Azospirillum himalayense TaxID=654847 RepID=A0ABW0G974_9PROT
MKAQPESYASLVDADQGIVSREVFVNQEVFEQEIARIFARAWLFVGHESLIPNPDDYFVSRMGMDSVILTRDRQGNIHVLLNSCMHRGMKLCRHDQGNARALTCPYHGWSYSTDGQLVETPGELVGVPGLATHYHGQLDKKAWGLVRCPNVVNYKGTIWASWDKEAPPFLDYLGDMKFYLDAALDHRDGREGGSEVFGGVQKWRVKCNWKFAPENFIGDMYHDISHRSVDLVGIGPSAGKGRRDASRRRMTIGFPGLGHGLLGQLPHTAEDDYVPLYTKHPEVEAYFREVHAARVRNLGDRMRVQTSVGTIFPNMSFHGRQPRTIAVFHPIGPTEMEMWRFYLVDKDAPQAVKDATRHYYLRYSGPAGMTESDDLENWSYATEASKAPLARQHAYNYQMGLGHAQPIKDLRGAVQSGDVSEENQRIFYSRWADFMTGKSWADLIPG